jgi:hypothetical protein
LTLKYFKHIISPLAFLLLLAFFSCKRTCDFVPVSNAGVRFYTISSTKQEVPKSFDSIFVYPLNLEDSILYNWARNLNSVRLPLSPFEDFSDFVFTLNDITDTVQILYKRQLYFVSEECGFSVNFSLDSILFTTNQLDSVIIIQPKVQAINEEHIRFYF